jgi:hypothetical protein
MNSIVTGRSNLLFNLETHLEQKIAADVEWQAGLEWGQPRPGHPEGQAKFHIRDVLQNIDYCWTNSDNRARLRLITLIHDTFKYKRAQIKPGTSKQSHGYWARQFAERYLDDEAVLEVIALHDEAYKAFRSLLRSGPEAAERQAKELITRLGPHLDLFMQFYLCDHRTGDKSTGHYEWFKELVEKRTCRLIRCNDLNSITEGEECSNT